MLKKPWNTPTLNPYASIETVTQMDANIIAQARPLLFPNPGEGLLASLEL